MIAQVRAAARLAVFVVAGAAYPLAGALAGCIHTNQLYSCVDAQGNSLQLYCFGAGEVQTCIDFAGGWVLVSPHEVLSQITTTDMDSQLSSALAARGSQADAGPQVATPSVGGSIGPSLSRAPSPAGQIGH